MLKGDETNVLPPTKEIGTTKTDEDQVQGSTKEIGTNTIVQGMNEDQGQSSTTWEIGTNTMEQGMDEDQGSTRNTKSILPILMGPFLDSTAASNGSNDSGKDLESFRIRTRARTSSRKRQILFFCH